MSQAQQLKPCIRPWDYTFILLTLLFYILSIWLTYSLPTSAGVLAKLTLTHTTLEEACAKRIVSKEGAWRRWKWWKSVSTSKELKVSFWILAGTWALANLPLIRGELLPHTLSLSVSNIEGPISKMFGVINMAANVIVGGKTFNMSRLEFDFSESVTGGVVGKEELPLVVSKAFRDTEGEGKWCKVASTSTEHDVWVRRLTGNAKEEVGGTFALMTTLKSSQPDYNADEELQQIGELILITV